MRSASPALVRWLPLLAVALHLVEEFVWPGGFAAWFRAYRPERASSVTTGLLVQVNAILVALAVGAAALGERPYGVALWLVVASIGAANAVFHVRAMLAMRRYSPGVVTAVAVYVPLAAWGFVHFVSTGQATAATAVQAALVGPLYHVYSWWRHGRRAGRAD